MNHLRSWQRRGGMRDHENGIPLSGRDLSDRLVRVIERVELGWSSSEDSKHQRYLARIHMVGSSVPSSPNQVFILRNNPGSTSVTGTWQGEFKIVGTFSPSTGQATLVAGVYRVSARRPTSTSSLCSSRLAQFRRTTLNSPDGSTM